MIKQKAKVRRRFATIFIKAIAVKLIEFDRLARRSQHIRKNHPDVCTRKDLHQFGLNRPAGPFTKSSTKQTDETFQPNRVLAATVNQMTICENMAQKKQPQRHREIICFTFLSAYIC